MLRIGVGEAGHPDVGQNALKTRNGEREMRATVPEVAPERHRHSSCRWVHAGHHLSTVIDQNQQDMAVTSYSASPYT